MSILVIGESCADVFSYGLCNRMCPEAPVPVFNPVSETQNGGMAMNVKNNLSALEVENSIITNANWEEIRKTRYIDQRTNQMFIRVDSNESDYPNIGKKISDIDLSLYKAVIVSDYNKGFLSERDIEFICESNDCVFLDTKKLLGDWCRNAKFIKINIHELEKTAHTVSDEIADKIIVTLGSGGCEFDGVVYPVEEVQMKDSSGAGDTFIAALAAKYVQTSNIEESLRFANQCATIVVQKRGVGTV